MKTEILVSVIIPTYNRAQSVTKAIDSVLNQHYKNIEIIVVDDGSTDNTLDVLAPYFDHILYEYQANNGQAAARNAGLKRACGELIASLDSDDVWDPKFLSKCVARMELEKLDFVFTNWSQQTKDGEWIDSFSRYFFLDEYINASSDRSWVNIEYDDLRKLYLKYCPSPSSSFLIRKKKIVNGWNTSMNVADDWCLLLDTILTNPCKVAFTNEILWSKGINEINVCDGRNVVELARLLYIDDIKNLMSRFKKYVNPFEYKIFEIVYIENLIKLGSYHMLKENNISRGLKLWRQALGASPAMTIQGIGNIIGRKTLRLVGVQQKEII